MRGLHFLTSAGIECIGLDARTRASYCADAALPGEYVVLAEDVDPATPMRKLHLEQQHMVEHRELRVSSVWLTVDNFNDSGVLWSEYEFDGIEGKFRGDAFIDARFAGHATGALLHVDGELWLLPVLGSIQQEPRRFGNASASLKL